MAADYTRTIVFKVEDQAIKRATERITKSLERIEKTLGRIEKKGFFQIAKGADQASRSMDKAATSAAKLNKVVRLGQGIGVLGLGAASAGVAINQIDKVRQGLHGMLGPLAKLVPGLSGASIQATGLVGALGKLGALATGNPVAVGIIALSYLRLGQNLASATKGAYQLGSALGGVTKGALSSLRGDLNTSLDFSVKKFQKLNIEATNFVNLLKVMNPGSRGNIVRSNLRSSASRRGSGFAEWSRGAGEYNPYGITSPKEGNPWHSIGGPPRSHLMGSLDPISKSIARHTKKIAKDTAKLAQIGVKSQRAAAVPSPIVPGVLADPRAYAPGTAGPARRPGSWQNMFSMGRGGAGKGLFGATGGSRMSNMVSSGMIGGGFPLLFGQGGLAATGGGLGGVLGGALGGGFGFGLSIVGTAIASRISEGREFEKQITKVNAAIKATGSTSTFTSKSIKNLGKVLGMSKDEALQAAQSFAQFDAAMRTSLLITFGDEATFNLVKGLKTNVDLIESIQQAESKIGREKADQLLQMLKVEGSLKVQKKLQEEIMKVTKEQQKGTKRTNFLDWINPFRGMLEFGHKREDGTVRAMTPSELQDARTRKFEEQTGVNRESGAEQLDTELNRAFDVELITRIASVRDEIEKLTSPMYMLTQTAQTVGDSFGESFKGIIKGSLTAQQALANLFQRTADMFLDMAAQMIAKQIQMKVLGIGLNFMGGGFGGGSNMGGGGYYNPNTGKGTAGPNFGLADGGTAQGGKTYLVGERGPELFVPGKTGTVVPNHELGGGGNVSVNVAVDASGTSAQGDQPSAQELGRLIGAAVQSELVRQKRPGGVLY